MTYPNNTNGAVLVIKENLPSGEIVAGWDKNTNPYEQVVVPSNGWVNVKTKCRNYESATDANNGIFEPRLIETSIGNNIVSRATAGAAGLNQAIGACTDNMFPVRAGDIIKYGSNSVTPNGKFSEVTITFFPFQA